MLGEISDISILHTKLHRPKIFKDHIHREDLLGMLCRQRQRPLTLVSAPAGYGKSTLVSCWLDDCNMPSSWVSLDHNDNDLRSFLTYFVAAIQQLFPHACGGTLFMLKTAHMPPVATLTGSLINELEQIDEDFVLVLDDYHFIRHENIHQLIANILNYPTLCMCLVLICRRDPPLPLARLRAMAQMVEIRVQDLRFSFMETKKLLQQILEVPVDDAVAAILESKTEGWVIGLRLAGISLRNDMNSQLELTNLQVENAYVMDYIVAEIISLQQPAIQQCLLQCSILDRFCASLCEAVCNRDHRADAGDANGSRFLETLNRDKLFVIPLDDEGIWFRYHHLFQAILKRQLKKQAKAEEISRLNKLASAWFVENGYADEAISHAFESGDQDLAARLVKQYRHDIINRQRWGHLNRWLQKFPHDYFKTDPELLLAKAWVYQRQARYTKSFEILDEIEHIVSRSDRKPGIDRSLWGELQVLRSFQYYANGQATLSETTAREALDFLPLQKSGDRGFALLIMSAALQMQGKLHLAYQVVHEAMAKEEVVSPIYNTMLLVALCYTSWIAADSKKLKLAADQTLKYGQENDLKESAGIGRFFSGILCYQQNQLALAENFLSSAVTASVTDELAIPSIITYCQSVLALSATYQAMGREKEASEVVESIIGYMLESGNVDLLELCQAFQADLALRMGKIGEAEVWKKNYIQKPLAPSFRFYTADLTPVRILLARRTAESLCEADTLLGQFYSYNATIYNTRMLIDILILQAMVHAAQRDETKALSKLMEVLALTEPAGFIRPFLDQGSEMADLLGLLLKQHPTLSYARQIYSEFGSSRNDKHLRLHDDTKNLPQSLSDDHFTPPLSNREIEVLKALANGLSNNEIADTLFISTETVKRHLSTIYQKLDVKNRHQAVLSGKSFGIL